MELQAPEDSRLEYMSRQSQAKPAPYGPCEFKTVPTGSNRFKKSKHAFWHLPTSGSSLGSLNSYSRTYDMLNAEVEILKTRPQVVQVTGNVLR